MISFQVKPALTIYELLEIVFGRNYSKNMKNKTHLCSTFVTT